MSLASDYATLQASAAADLVSANEGQPPPFVSTNGRAEVTTAGGLRFIPAPGTSRIEVDLDEALGLADWIAATFGDSG